MNRPDSQAERFLRTLDIVHREGKHLLYSWQRLFGQGHIDRSWVESLDGQPELAERLEAFVSRFGRMQDTIADKLLPRWLIALAEKPASQIETLNRAERLGVLDDVEQWLTARALRNRLIHEYMEDPETFAGDLLLARDYTPMLIDVYNRVRAYAITPMALDTAKLPGELASPDPSFANRRP
ncbi:MAG TPA: hypothetical protein ENK05_01025 [Gammaproteobacteria bacterium]|nr:hypothetical protein [Gammaproteobacteria bacterium]